MCYEYSKQLSFGKDRNNCQIFNNHCTELYNETANHGLSLILLFGVFDQRLLWMFFVLICNFHFIRDSVVYSREILSVFVAKIKNGLSMNHRYNHCYIIGLKMQDLL